MKIHLQLIGKSCYGTDNKEILTKRNEQCGKINNVLLF